jgi:iron(III) transport system substrate-binding protein
MYKMFKKVRLSFVSILAAVIVAVTAFSIPISKAVASELVIYSGRHYADAINEEFTKKTGIRVKVHSAGSVELFNRLVAEGERTPADILITVDAGTLERARIAGILQPMKSDVIDNNVPAAFRAPDNSWVGLTLRTRVIAYNPERVTPDEVKMLKRYSDLTLPIFAGRLGIRTGTNVYPQSHAAMFIAQMGEPATEMWLRGLVLNARDKIYPSDMRVVEAVAAGEVDLGLVNNYYVYRGWLDKRWNIPKSRLAYIVPEQGRGELGKSFNVSGAGVVRASKNKEAAQKFIEFLTTKEANARLARDNHEYPINPASEVHPEMRSVKDFRLAPVSLSIMARYMIPAIDLIDKVGYR